MRNLFSPDSKFMATMSRVGDLLLLNFFYLITSVPIFTIGASTAALYTVCFHFDTDGDVGTTRGYFIAFRDNFKSATRLWLPLLLFGLAMMANIYLFASLPSAWRYVFVLFCILLILVIFTFSYAFPLQSQFENTPKQTRRNALILSLAFLPRTIIIAGLLVLPWIIMLLDFILFLQLAFLWAAIYFSAIAYFSTFLFKKVFAPYMPHDEDDSESEEN